MRKQRRRSVVLCGNRTTDQRLCFRYIDSTIHPLPKLEISCLQSSSVTVQSGLCRTWLETPKTSFLTTRLTCGSLVQDGVNLTLKMSCLISKALFRVSNQVQHKPGCSISKDGKRHDILDLGSRGIVLSV